MKNNKKRKLKPLATTDIENIKHSLSPGQIIIKPHTKSPIASVPVSQFIRPGFHQKLPVMLNDKGKHILETKQETKPDSDMAPILELLDRELKVTMINIFKPLMKKQVMCKNK